MDKDLISAIGELWKLGASAFLFVICIIFKKEIKLIITKIE